MTFRIAFVAVCAALMSVTLAKTTLVPIAALQCQDDSECSADKCCSKIPNIMAASKRQLAPLPDLQYIVSSSCQPYIPTNGSCVNVISVNGDCGCAPDHICKHFPDLDQPFIHPGKRDFFPWNPLAYRCIPKNV